MTNVHSRLRALTLAAALPIALVCLLPTDCLAQIGGGNEALQTGRRSRAQPVAPPVIQPPALPGVKANPTAVAPPARGASDLPPTEALFDAIHRGDLVVARDAIGRGAELGARNLLGLTPTEMSIDLGRTEITFLLLSLRAEAARGGQPDGTAAPRAEVVRRPVATNPAAIQRDPTTPRLFANDGGAPIPSIGFLGFDAGRAVR